jgi:hypothetical protein
LFINTEQPQILMITFFIITTRKLPCGGFIQTP